jgi:hypothetical protein
MTQATRNRAYAAHRDAYAEWDAVAHRAQNGVSMHADAPAYALDAMHLSLVARSIATCHLAASQALEAQNADADGEAEAWAMVADGLVSDAHTHAEGDDAAYEAVQEAAQTTRMASAAGGV